MVSSRSRLVIGGATLAVVALIAGVLAFRSDGGTPSADPGPGGEVFLEPGAEVFLEPAASAGPDPFSDSVADPLASPVTVAPTVPATVPETVPANDVATVPETGPATVPETIPPSAPAVELPNPSASTARTPGILRFSGTTPGLYGGTRNQRTCDVEALSGFLVANPAKAEAWSSVLGVDASNVAEYLASLTPALLRRDTRVTNHGFRAGRATPRQAVLQGGTAVLVDSLGRPRVKCACGNPLLDPVASPRPPVFLGDPWTGFDPDKTIAIGAGDTPVDDLDLIDPDTGLGFQRPVGSRGSDDGASIDLSTGGWPDQPSVPRPPVGGGGDSGPDDLESIDPETGIGRSAAPPDDGAGIELTDDPDVAAIISGSPPPTTPPVPATTPPTAPPVTTPPATIPPTTRPTTPPATAPPATAPPPTAPPTTPVTTPPTTPAPVVSNLTGAGRASASTIYSAEFPVAFAFDGDLATSWFSAGPGPGGTTDLTWTADTRIRVRRIEVLSNARHRRTEFRRGFGFGRVVLQVLDADGTVVFTDTRDLSGTPDPDVAFDLDVLATTVRLTFTGHEDPTCGGIGELIVRGSPL